MSRTAFTVAAYAVALGASVLQLTAPRLRKAAKQRKRVRGLVPMQEMQQLDEGAFIEAAGATAAVVEVSLPRRFRLREYRLVPDTEPDAEPTMVASQCCVCEERSDLGEDPNEAARWVLDHLKANPDHFTYRALTSTPVRAQPEGWL